MKSLANVLQWAGGTLLFLVVSGWVILMLHYSDLPGRWLPEIAAVAYSLFAIWMAVIIVRSPKSRWRAIGILATVWVALIAWFLSIEPSDARDWQADAARPPRVSVNGDRMTIENVRNFAYRSGTDFDARWETRRYALSRLDGHDLMVVYWGGMEAVAHTMVSFRFRDDTRLGGFDFLVISIEARREESEAYSPVAGAFRRYELYYVIADERDAIAVRTNHRDNEIYLYRTLSTPERSRALLLNYLKTADELSREPAWYNTLTDNCTNGILYHVRSLGDELPYTWEILLNGYADRYAYKAGGLSQALSFQDLKRRSRINDAAKGHVVDESFSAAIRSGLPGYAPER
jgi:Domain of unknown function (DUF4105)